MGATLEPGREISLTGLEIVDGLCTVPVGGIGLKVDAADSDADWFFIPRYVFNISFFSSSVSAAKYRLSAAFALGTFLFASFVNMPIGS